MGITSTEHGHAIGHVCADGVFPVHRKATIDGFLEAFGIQCLVEYEILILQATTLKKIGDVLAYAR